MLTYRPLVAPPGAAPSLGSGSRRRRQAQRSLQRILAWTGAAAGDPAQEVLRNTLSSACAVIGADRGFILRLRDDAVLEVAAAQALPPHELLDAVLGRAARALHQAMVGGSLGLADASGLPLPHLDGSFEENAPAVVALPLELAPRQHGVLCLMRSGAPRALSELDLEILGALADQAALALRAAQQHSALSKLAASLNGFAAQPA